jgi:hypothetical protein
MNFQIPEDIVNAPVPAKTDSYSPVKHMDVVNAIQEMLDKKNISIKDANWWSNKGGNQMIGKFNLDFGGDAEMGGMLAFKNSYDKSMALGFAGGGNVFICANGVVNGEIVLIRRHTGSIVEEVNDKITESIDTLDVRFQELISHREKMKEVELTSKQNAEMLGRMYFEEELLNSTQLNSSAKKVCPTSGKKLLPHLAGIGSSNCFITLNLTSDCSSYCSNVLIFFIFLEIIYLNYI